MPCCKCNKTGRCRNCACVKAGKSCQNCLPSRLGQCLNSNARPDSPPSNDTLLTVTSTLASSLPLNAGISQAFPPASSAPVPSTALNLTPPQTLDAQNPIPIDPHQPQSASPLHTPSVSWPLPAPLKANFVWGSKDGELFQQDICSAYERVIHWKSNLFLPPFGTAGKSFVEELACLLQAYADSSSLECIAMKGIVILQQLLLQNPSRNCKAKECAKHLQRCLELWLSGDVDALLNEGLCIQKRLRTNRPSREKHTLDQSFANKMKQGNVNGALNSLSTSFKGGVLNLDDEISMGANIAKRSVRDILADKHPASTVPSPDILLLEDQHPVAPSPIIFNSLNADLILKAAFKTKGAAGLLGLDAFAWRRLCSSFKSASEIYVAPLLWLIVDYALPLSTQRISVLSLLVV